MPDTRTKVGWVYRATIEVLKPIDAQHVIGDGARGFQFRPSKYSPAGKQRLDLFVSDSVAQHQATSMVANMLTAMANAAAAGRIRDFNVVHTLAVAPEGQQTSERRWA